MATTDNIIRIETVGNREINTIENIAGPDYQKTHTTNWTGPWAAQSGDLTYVKFGDRVVIRFPEIIVTPTNNNEIIKISVPLPTEIRPSFDQRFHFPTRDNGANGDGLILLDTVGDVSMYSNAALNDFDFLIVPAGTTGFYGTTIEYLI